MAEQLTILGLWERVAPEPEVAPALPPPPLPAPVDARQEELLSGAYALRSQLEAACVALDAGAVRAAHKSLVGQFANQAWAERVPAWADAIAWLVEPSAAHERATRALALRRDDQLPTAPRALFEAVRTTALQRAAAGLTAEQGPAAALSDGRPAGYLALVGGDFGLARTLLAAASESVGNSNAQWLGYLGEAAWGVGDRFGALQAWCRASLVDPSRIDQAHVTCEPVLELLDVSDELELSDEPHSYLAVLADLLGKHALDDFTHQGPDSAPRRLAALLRAYRRDRSAGALDEHGRIAAKRELARHAPPGLRELLRRL